MDDIKKIEECARYVFSKALGYEGQESKDLHITRNEEWSYYKYKGITTGFEGFLNMYKIGIDIEDIYYNGELFNEDQKIKFKTYIEEWIQSNQ